MTTFDRLVGQELSVQVTRKLLRSRANGWALVEHEYGGDWKGYRFSRDKFYVDILLRRTNDGQHLYDVTVREGNRQIGTIDTNAPRFDGLGMDENPLTLFYQLAEEMAISECGPVVDEAVSRVIGLN